MKSAADLRIPFSWAERYAVLLEKCLYIPGFYPHHEKWSALPWNDPAIFGKAGDKVVIEYCSGNGQWICEKARQNPSIHWVAVEKRFDRARKIWGRMQREALSNLFVVCGDGTIFTRHYAPTDSVDEIFVNFPDPWPKRRHAVNRIVQKQFMKDLTRIVRKGGRATLVTDDEVYRDQMAFEVAQSAAWKRESMTTEWPDYGDSWFANLWTQKGKTIYYQRYAHV
ncbi:MAG: tRNA (guanosine(46)-N7)-methyltransferase TrmB [Chlamydiia bacterium]|nr:tRNA (guanosine(46)-N7)-methyltransferase TrmB [Chlamydiia bacterium]